MARINGRTAAIANASLRIAIILSQFACNIVVTHALTPTEAGLYFTYWGAVAFAAIIGNFGLRTTSVYWISTSLAEGKPQDARAALLAAARMSHVSILSLSVAFGFLFYAYMLFFPTSVGMNATVAACLVAWSVLWGLQYSLSEVFRGFSNHILPGITGGLLSNVLFVSCIIICGLSGIKLHLQAILFITLLAHFINYLVIVTSIGMISGKLPAGGKLTIVGAWSQALVTSISQIALGTIQILDIAVVGLVSNAEEAAYYGVASRIAVFIGLPLQIAYSTALPSLTAMLWEKDTRQLQKLVKQSAFHAAVPSFAFAIVASLLGPFLLPLAFGEAYAKAAFYLPLVMLYQAAIVFGGLSGALLLAGGEERSSMKLSVVAAIACLSLQTLLGFCFGPTSIPLVSAVAVFALVIAQNAVCRQRFHVDCLVLPSKLFQVDKHDSPQVQV